MKINKAVITVGTFDGIHLGHRQVINRLCETAETIGGQSVVFSFCPHPRLVLKNAESKKFLLNTCEEKTSLFKTTSVSYLILYPFTSEFAKLGYIDFIKKILVEKLNLEYLVVGHDNQLGNNRQGNIDKLTECAQKFNFKIIEIKAQSINGMFISSTKIRNELLNGNIHRANAMLGYNYSISGLVISGNNIGRTIGFPTANISINENKLIPADGVYAILVYLSASKHKGMLYIGNRPTIKTGKTERRIEAHIFDFNQSVYNQKIKVEIVAHIRNDKKFKDIEALKKQLQTDKIKATRLLAKCLLI